MCPQRKAVANSKYGSTMTELYKMRVTPEQKELLFTASPQPDLSASEFWRDLSLRIAALLKMLREGELTTDEFGERMRVIAVDIAEAYLSSYGEQDEP